MNLKEEFDMWISIFIALGLVYLLLFGSNMLPI